MLQMPVDDKRGAIVKAAFEVFITYGFRKTSMDDIARAAGMSRPALYQLFGNKTDIFRALADDLLSEVIEKARAAMAQGGTFRERLDRAMQASILDMHRFIEQTPHGTELIGINDEIAADISDKWTEALAGVVAEGIEQARHEGLVSLDHYQTDAMGVARIFVLALEGLKYETMRGRSIEHPMQRLVDFMARALQPPHPDV